MIRFFDIFFSLSAIIFLSPLLIIISIILKLTGENEIFYFQNRIGINGEEFKLIKFTTMLKDSENMGTGTITVKNDPRVLPFGRFLRKTKINELPQIFNVIKGNMSIIGPRPQTKRCFMAFSKKSQESIKKVLPGLSGIGSVQFRDEEELMSLADDPDRFYDDIVMPYKGELEEWYIDNLSLFTYFSLIALTVLAVFFPNKDFTKTFFKDLPEKPLELK